MKVLVVSNMYPDNKYPSAGIFVKRFCGELAKLGVNYDISVMYQSSNIIHKLIRYFVFYASTLWRILFSNYDIVYVHYASHSSIPVLIAKKIKKVKVYTNVHGSDVVPESKCQFKLQKYTAGILEQSEKVIVPSEYFKKYLLDKYKINEGKVHVYPSAGVNREIFRPYSDEVMGDISRKLLRKPHMKTFSYVGRVSAMKGWKTYLRAIALLIDKGYEANFLFVGDGSEIEQFNYLVEELNLSHKITKFPLLSQSQLADIYNVSDAFIFPTEREGESLGLVAIEAMACGTPVLSSDFAAPKYYVLNGINGFQFKKGSVEELSVLMERFLTNELNKKDFHRGVKDTAEKFTDQKIFQQLKSIIMF